MAVETLAENLVSRLEALTARHGELESQMSQPEIASDAARLTELAKERGRLDKLVSIYREYKQAHTQLEEAQQITGSEQPDPDLLQLALEELPGLEAKVADVVERVKNSLVCNDDLDVDSCIVEIRAGTGGGEAALFVRDLYQMYSRYAESQSWKMEVIDLSPTDLGGLREIIFSLTGRGAYNRLAYEGGGHRVQRVPVTEAQGRIHTSAATVAVLPEPEKVQIDIKSDEVREEVSRSSGPGGQNVNKVSSAVKLIHLATGITVSMQDEKSQHKNRAKAWRILRSRVFDHYESIRRAERDSTRRNMIGSGDRSQRIRTYNFPQNRVTDHRINLDLYYLDRIIAGELDALLDALQAYDRQQRLENL
ncbi:MAG: peptide chain release factor 1 [Actinobacteria bacterium]|nr:peptide chain release factor 1 [Actinomycetota bacterium]